MKNPFVVGQKVVCINDDFARKGSSGKGPRRGRVYTVRVVCPEGVSLKEFPRKHGYFYHRFRPAVEHKNDISIFTKMLDKETLPVN